MNPRSVTFSLIVLAGPLSAGDLQVVISEVHYHSPAETAAGDPLEFIEIRNLAGEPAILAGCTLEGGIDFVFPGDAVVEPHGYLVVAQDAARIEADYGIASVLGNFTGRLPNGRGRISLRDRDGALVDRVAYRDEDPWPENPDGLGPSLEKTDLSQDGENQASWRASIVLGGTPGGRNSTDLRLTVRTLIAAGAAWRYRKGTAEPAAPLGAWARLDFNDASWSSGPSGFGYDDGDDATVLTDMRGSYTTVYIRRVFALSSPDGVESLLLTVVYDDGYVAYLNGAEVGRSASAGGTPGTPLPSGATAAGLHDADEGQDTIELAAFKPLLRAGDNVLAIQVLNQDIQSGDLSMIPTLTAVESEGAGLVEPAHDLEVNEVFAGAGAQAGFVEIYNEAEQAAGLAGYKLVSSPTGKGGYAFPAGTSLAGRSRLVVPRSSLPFALAEGALWLGLVTPDLRFVDGLSVRARPAGRSFGRHPDGDGDTFVLEDPTPGAPNTVALESRVVINEVQYHPPLASATAEYVELYNRGAVSVDVSGWSLVKAVRYTIPAPTSIAPGGHLLIARDPAAVESRHGVAGVLGPWTGALANSAEKVELEDALGNRVDVVHYADDGAWPASTATAGPDGFGSSIELVSPAGENNHGSAWQASAGAGTPLARNSRFAADGAPVIRSVAHAPSLPRSQDAVAVTARVADETLVASVSLFSRLDGAAGFSQAAMLDDGLRGDGPAGDGVYGAELPARPAGAIVQFYLEAADGGGRTRRFPADAPASVCLYQVDDRAYPFGLPLYRAVLRGVDLQTLVTRPVDSDVLLDGTFIRGKDIHYQVGVRYRGDNSRNLPVKAFRIELNHDQPFEGITKLNLNAEDNHLAHLAADFIRRADLPVFQTRPVAYSLNGSWQAAHGGVYLRVEAVDDEFLERAFPGDDQGSLYRGLDPPGDGEGDLSYLGESAAAYLPFYDKRTRLEENDYSDLITLTRTLSTTPEATFPTVVDGLVDVDQWLRYFALETVLNNQDGAISTDTGEDYFIYRRPADGRWVLIPWDQNENFQDPADGIYRMGIAAVRRLVLHPAFVGRYQAFLLEALDGPFAREVMSRRTDAARGAFSAARLDEVAAFVPVRQQAIRSLLPRELAAGVEPRYLVRTGDPWRFFRGTREPSGGTTAWTGINFNDGGWEEGPGGFGYGDGDDRTTLLDMEDGYTTVYLRRSFTLDDPASLGDLTLSVRFDDGFVLYLNGAEVARRDVTGTVSFDSEADTDHEAAAPTTINLSSFRNLLRTGKNVIAAVGVNSSITSSDLTLDPEVYAPAQGSGCGSLLFARSAAVSLGGTAPVPETASVRVNGLAASYDPLTGRWHLPVALAAGLNSFNVIALDANAAEIESAAIEVLRAGSLATASGTLATTRWSEAGGPYHVTGDLTVPAGAALTIDPGVSVYVDAGASIVIRGTLNAGGSGQKPIRFLGSDCAGSWGGMVFAGASAQGTLIHARIEGAARPSAGAAAYPAAVSIDGGAQVRVEGSMLTRLDGPAIDVQGASQLVILDSIIEGATEGLASRGSRVELERVTVRGLVPRGSEVPGDCIRLEGASAPASTIRGCSLAGGGKRGIALRGASPLIEGNVVFGPRVGIAIADGAAPVLRHNTVSRCGVGLHLFEGAAGAGGGHATGDSLIVWGNAWSVLLDPLSTLALTQSDVEGGYPGAGNIDLDPLFVDAQGGDFHLREGSPAEAAGKDGEDMGAYSSGASPSRPFIRGDANQDGAVDLSDALRVLLHLFGGAGASSCLDAFDVNDAGDINATDAIALLHYLFRLGASPASPFPGAGQDPTAGDPYGCE